LLFGSEISNNMSSDSFFMNVESKSIMK